MAMMNGMVCGIFLVATSLPSTFRTPVPPLPKPGPSYLKSNTMVCLPGASASWPSQRNRSRSSEVVEKHRLALEQVEAVAAEAAAQGDEHSFGAALRDLHLGGDRVGLVQDARRIAGGQAGHLAGVGEDVPPGGRARPRRDEALQGSSCPAGRRCTSSPPSGTAPASRAACRASWPRGRCSASSPRRCCRAPTCSR